MIKWKTVTEKRLDGWVTHRERLHYSLHSRLEKLICIFYFTDFLKVSIYISNKQEFKYYIKLSCILRIPKIPLVYFEIIHFNARKLMSLKTARLIKLLLI